MSVTELLGRMLGVENAVEIGRIEPSLAASWAHDAPAWVLLAAIGLIALVALFYTRFQIVRRARTRVILAVFRAACWCLLLLILAEPVVTVHITSRLRPSLWVLFDGTDSMGIADDLPPSDRAKLATAVGWSAEGAAAAASAAPVRAAAIPATSATTCFVRRFFATGTPNAGAGQQRRAPRTGDYGGRT